MCPLSRPHCSFMGMMISHDMLLGRWRLSLELFGRVFMEDVGAEPGSVMVFFLLHSNKTVKLLCICTPVDNLNNLNLFTFLYLISS